MSNKYFQIIVFSSLLLFESCSTFSSHSKNDFDEFDGESLSKYNDDEIISNDLAKNSSEPQNFSQSLLNSGSNANVSPYLKRQYQNGGRAKKEDFMDQTFEEGSLWTSSGQTNYFFTKNFVRNPGDIIQIKVEKELHQDIGTETKRTLGIQEKEIEIQKVKENIRSQVTMAIEQANLEKNAELKKDQIKTSAASAEKNPSSDLASASEEEKNQANQKEEKNKKLTSTHGLENQDLNKLLSKTNLNDVDIFQSVDLKEGEIMKGEILERFPNGNYKVRALKKVTYQNGPPRIVSVLGIIKGTDIGQEGETIPSGKFYEYRVDVSH